MLEDDELLEAIERDWRTAKLGARREAMLTYALKLSETPRSMGKVDVEALRSADFSDLDILHIAELTAYYAYVNRIADGLGVELESR